MLDETFIEMERGAKALDLHDVNTAAVCLRKALEGHITMAPPGPTPPPQAVSPLAELAKAINALEVKDFSLAALCGEKAARGVEGHLPDHVVVALRDTARALRGQELGSAANYLRVIIRNYRPDITLPEPAGLGHVAQVGDSSPALADVAAPAPTEPSVIILEEEPALVPKF